MPFDWWLGLAAGISVGALIMYMLVGNPKDYAVGYKDGFETARRRYQRRY